SCAWGVEYLGYVMIAYGSSAALSSFFLGEIIQFTGRIFLFVLVSMINIAAVLILLLWSPNSRESYVFFIVAALWGITEGFWSPQIAGIENMQYKIYNAYK